MWQNWPLVDKERLIMFCLTLFTNHDYEIIKKHREKITWYNQMGEPFEPDWGYVTIIKCKKCGKIKGNITDSWNFRKDSLSKKEIEYSLKVS